MSKVAKYSLFAALFIGALLIAAIIAIKVLVTPERIKAVVLPLAEKQLQRQVSLGDIQVGLLSGIELRDFKVATKDGKTDFIATDALVFKYQFMPLLSGQVKIDEVRLVNPRIRVERLADGSFNFSDLLKTSEKAPSANDTADSASTTTDVELKIAAVDNGRLDFIDRQINPQKPFELTVDQFNAQVSNFSLDQTFPFKVAALINNGRFSTEGQANLASLDFTLESLLEGMDVRAFLPYFEKALPGTLNGLNVGMNLKAQGTPANLSAKGKVVFTDLNLALQALPDAPILSKQSQIDFDTRLDLAAGTATLEPLTVTFNQVPVAIQGQLTGLTGTPSVDLKVNLQETDLATLMAAVPPGLLDAANQFKPSGKIALDLALAGSTEKPQALLQQGQLTLNRVRAEAAGYAPIIDGALTLQGMRARTENLQILLADQQVNAAVDIRNVTQMPIVGTVAISADRIDVDAITAQGATSSPKKSDAKKTAAKEEIGPYDIPAAIDGTIRIGTALVNKIAMTDVAVDFTLKNNVLVVNPIQAKVADGSVSGNSRVNLGVKGLAYSSDVQIKQVAIEKVLPGFWPKLAGAIVGKITMDAKADGKGTLMETLKKNLNGSGQLQLFGGKIATTGVTEGLASFTQVEELKTLNFDQLALDFLVNNGKVKLSGNADGKEASFAPKGEVGLGGKLDMNLGMKLAPEIAKKTNLGGAVGKFLQDDAGQSMIPLKLGGTLSQPAFALDEAFVQQQLKKKGQDKLQKILGDKLLKKGTAPSDGAAKEGTEADPKKKLLNDTLKNLLGK